MAFWRNLTRRFRTFLDRVGIRRIRFHDLRHSTATLLLEQDVDLVVIKELLGHAHIGVTADVYAHVRLRLQRQAIDTLGHALEAIMAGLLHVKLLFLLTYKPEKSMGSRQALATQHH